MKPTSFSLLFILLLSIPAALAQESGNPDVRDLESTLLQARPLRTEGRPGRRARTWFAFA